MRTHSYTALIALVLLLGLSTGCSMVQTFPMAARAGDTITLGVGSIEGMTRNNTTVTYVPNDTSQGQRNLTANIRSIFNIYADEKSSVYNFGRTLDIGGINSGAGHEAWQTVVAVDLPANLSPGTGAIYVDTSAEVPQFPSVPPLNTIPMTIEILPGTGSSNPFKYNRGGLFSNVIVSGNFSEIEPLPRVIVKPPASGVPIYSETRFGAIEIKLDISTLVTSNGAPIARTQLRLVTEYLSGWGLTQLQPLWTLNGSEMRVLFISPDPAGIIDKQTRLTIVPASNVQLTAPPTLISVSYYDLNGALVNGSGAYTILQM